MGNINERLDSLRGLFQDRDFIEGKGLSNEVNIRMFCYDPKDEMAVRHFMEKLKADKDIHCNIIEYNLYRIFLSICDDKRITDKIPAQEEKKGTAFVLEQLKRMASNTAYISKMNYERESTEDVIVITGVGEVFPFMRVHSLLDAMQPHFLNVPIVVMYPGAFDGYQMTLFDRFRPSQYYRAFNVV